MNAFLREKPDGRLAPGYAAYLLGGIIVLAAVLLLHRRFATADLARGGARPRSSHLASITQPAVTMSRIDVESPPPPPETRSYRLEKRADRPPAPVAAASVEGFDPIAAAVAQRPADPGSPVEDGQPRALDEKGGGQPRPVASPYAELPPAFSNDPAPASGRSLEYRDPLAGSGSGGAKDLAGGGTVPAVPRGTLIPVYLLTTVDTSNPSAILQFAAARSLVLHRRREIPFGTRFLGKLSGPASRDRLNLSVATMLFPDGQELPISASAVEADETGGDIRPGLGACYFPPPAWVELAPYLSDVVTGYLGLLEARAQPQLSVGLGGVSVQAASAAAEPRTAAYQASAQALQDFTQSRLKELEQRYASYYLVPAGTACWLQLEADWDPTGPGGAHPGRSLPE